MKRLAILIVALFIITGCHQNEIDLKDIRLAWGHIEGCIEENNGQIYLYNDSRKTMLRSKTIAISKTFIVGQNYRVEYDYLLESSPGRAEVINYEEISTTDYCKR